MCALRASLCIFFCYVFMELFVWLISNIYLEFWQSRTQSPRSSWSKNEELWHNPFVSPTNPGNPVLLHMCKVFQDGEHVHRNRHYI